jgi:thiol-disulfide isomerase/thioredoxin
MNMTFRRFSTFLLVAFFAGCQPSSDVGTPNTVAPVADQRPAAEEKADPSADGGTAPAKVEVSVASWDEVQAQIAGHKGKIVVVDLWSTSCLPCILELPHLAELQRQFPESVACLSVSLDYTGAENETPESHREKVLKLLEPRQMTVQNFISSTSDFDIYDKIELASIPAVLVYDREGKLLKRFDNDKNDYGDEGFTYAEHIGPLVEQALAE